MKVLKYLVATGMAILITGCPTRSLFPLFAEKDLVFNPALIGTWGIEDEGTSMTFEKSGDKSYTVTFHEKENDAQVYHVRMGRLGQDWFLDSSPADNENDYHFISTHIISKIKLEGDALQISFLENDYLQNLIEQKKLRTPHVRRGSEIILTGTSGELQELVRRFAGDENAFPDPDVFVRMK